MVILFDDTIRQSLVDCYVRLRSEKSANFFS